MTCMVLNTFTARLHRLVSSRSKTAKRNSHTLVISAPFGFKRETINLPGLSEDEIASFKEKVAAGRLDDGHDSSSAFGNPRKAPRAPPSPADSAVVTVTSLSPEDPVF